MTFAQSILQLSIWIIVVPLVAGLVFFRFLDAPSRLVLYLVILAAIPQLLTATMHHNRNLNIIYNIYTPVEFLFFYLLLGNKLKQQVVFKTISFILIVVFLATLALLTWLYGIKDKFLNELVCVANITYLFWVFMFILKGLLNDEQLLNTRLPIFWFIAGLLLYTPCTIYVFAMTYYIEQSTNPFIHNLWSIHGIFNSLLYIFFSIGFYMNYRTVRTE